ncbi:DUF1801 domain-containing protein [Kineococcus rubinsiae]|uniref:DUF1801 domain-containing protein n=1 Tax=Kineococcus rubinsiae TaxID=2609562 RepID=UPI001AD94616|nr:DUF1801 domain-containing protein [Kineococcus rubinsiae]
MTTDPSPRSAPPPARAGVSPEAQRYLDAVADEHRPLLDRLDGLVRGLRPDVTVVLSYGMPTYVAGRSRVHVGVWKHGLSLYGWAADDDGGFCARHPELTTGRGTIRLPTARAGEFTDEELLAVLAGGLRG